MKTLKCQHCGKEIDAESPSIEHRVPWEISQRPTTNGKFSLLYEQRVAGVWRLTEVIDADDGPEIAEQAVRSGRYTILPGQDLDMWYLLDRRLLTAAERKEYLRLQPNINHHELGELPAWFRPLYAWGEARQDYGLRPKYLEAWGVGQE